MRVQYTIIYALLCLGAVTMIYPFLMMLAGSVRSAVDVRELNVIPRFIYDDSLLYHKHLEGLFNESLDAMNMAYNTTARSFDSLSRPSEPNTAILESWQKFIQTSELPAYCYTIGYVRANVTRTLPLHLRGFKQYVAQHYGEDIEGVNRALGSEFITWNAFYIIPEDYTQRRNVIVETPLARAFRQYKVTCPLADRYYFSAEGFYRKLFLMSQYSRHINEYNESHGTDYASYDDIHLARILPKGTPLEQEDWTTFVRRSLNLLWIRIDPAATTSYRQFLQAKYGSVEALNQRYKTQHNDFSSVPLIDSPTTQGAALSDWAAFIEGWLDPDSGQTHIAAAEHLRVHSIDTMFRDYLTSTLGGIEDINNTWGTTYDSVMAIKPPQQLAHYFAFRSETPAIRSEFLTRNYVTVIEYLVRHGRGLLNTAIYCLLAVLAALIVNPMAAYAMSRYRMAASYKILLFLMLTMAFPPMVTQIPVFLMLREMKLLNTFAALVLPGLANGYAIFLLKGFFDSLPRELYESAQLDGASEWTMFWKITMSLSKPILSVIALQSFTIAYSNFMFALLICQDQKMWTLMVWLYQLQQRSGQAVIYASLIIAAIPTFLIFVFCQKIIMRGIVVPVEQ